ncbi:Transcriptional regulatory protein tctD [Phaeobacter italicus]|jgi:two-component system OmpR family response regulator|uniref:Transcriptional regulatory protein tctD n=2 Tax=Phaeobacter italicus TaxID=481446 RepID=A0A0H5CYJ7_9RHOB|nr:Transcriptional regulatory protein tctD [Phaeobacter italicus]
MYVHIKGMIPSSNSCILPYQPCAKLAHHDKDIGMRIAVIEDNEALAQGIAFRLRDRGHAVDLLHDGHEADAFLSREGADLVVLDLNLPGMDGIDILRALRRRGDGTPVILLTARSETSERVAGLDAGADDYLTKPFEMDELEARLRAMARRKNLEFAARDRLGPLVFDRTARQVLKDDRPLDIPRKEISTLECLLERRGRIVSKAHLITQIYGTGSDAEDSAIEPHVSRLRKRLEPYGLRIKTARGLGYMLEVDP